MTQHTALTPGQKATLGRLEREDPDTHIIAWDTFPDEGPVLRRGNGRRQVVATTGRLRPRTARAATHTPR